MMTRFLIACVVSLACPVPSAGQALPDLAPREVEIRGDLTIAFPSLRRQPLIGFNPPPRVPEIDVRRMPYVEAYKQRGAELSQNPLRNPSTPRRLAIETREGFTGTAEAGFGRYGTRFALLETSLYAGSTSRWTAELDYRGTSTFAPFGTDVSANGFSGGTAFSSSGKVSYGLEGSGSSEDYVLYGIDAAGTGGAVAAPTRSRSDLGGSFWLGSRSDARVTARALIEGFTGRLSTEVFGSAADPLERTDSGVTGAVDVAAGPFRLGGQAGAISFGSGGGRDVGHFDAGASTRLNIGRETTLQVGGRVLGFEAVPTASGGVRRVLTYFSPSFRLESALAPNVRLEVTQTPALGTARPGQLFKTNPYLVETPQIEPVINSVDAIARVRAFWSTFQASAIAIVRQSPNWRVFEHDPAPGSGYSRGLSGIRHAAARTVSLGGEIRLSPRPGLEARFGGRIQDGQMTDLDADLPYFPRWMVEGMFSTAFSGHKGLIQITSSVLGPRDRDVGATLEVPTYADLDVRLSYEITRQALAIVEARNLLGETPYWDHYPEPAATILFGVGWRW